MEIRQLRYFVAVAEHLHFGRAAELLGVVQPAVSQQVARLERELGVRLFTRTPRRVALTGDGERLLAVARDAVAGVERVRDVARELATGRAGTLRVGTSPELGPRLPRALARLRALAADVELVLVDGTPDAHTAAVAAGELDVALVHGTPRSTRVRVVEVGTDPVSTVAPARHDGLTGLALRLPPRHADPALHDAALDWCATVGLDCPRGRDVTSVRDVALEIGAGAAAWTLAYGDGADLASCAVAVRPLDPPLRVPVSLVLPAAGAGCAQTVVDAFGGLG